eukprot:TRINITY_DN4116_c0_g1_i1.p1 TRINITY_DN4116_c0_g1~~TRINITY_DN4116_c0_g1_i1.p1  ORF type:complete len:743 (+),score=265.29 TRINITY_DN4116_c0_g1_i1:53-2230(+)
MGRSVCSAWCILLCFAAPTAVSASGPDVGWKRPDNPMGKMYDKFYVDLPGAVDCVGMNGRSGNLQCFAQNKESPLYLVDSQAAWDDITKIKSSYSTMESMTVVMAPNLDIDQIRTMFNQTNRASFTYIDAIIFATPSVAQALKSQKGWSPMPTRPANDSDLYGGSQPEWNPNGMGLFGMRLPLFLRFYLTDSLGSAAEKAQANKDNDYTHPLWCAELNYVMNSKGKDAVACLNDTTCDQIGRASVWGSSGAVEPDTAKPLIGVTMPVSGTSLFTDSLVPAQGAVMGTIAAALAAIDTLSESWGKLNHDIAFFFFDAEQYGYSGSERFWKDITNFECYNQPQGSFFFCDFPGYAPLDANFTYLSKSRFTHLIALDQLGVVEEGDTLSADDSSLFLYYDEYMYTRSGKLASPTEAMLRHFESNGATRASSGGNFLPPSALHSFLRNQTERNRVDLGVVSMTGYDGAFNNKFYGSRYDFAIMNTTGYAPRLNTSLIAKAAQVLASTLYALGDGVGEPPKVNESLASDLTDCLGDNINCTLIMSYLSTCDQKEQMANFGNVVSMYPLILKPPTEVSLLRDRGNLNPVVKFIANFMVDKMALSDSSFDACSLDDACSKNRTELRCEDEEMCSFEPINGTSACTKAAVWYHFANSPAIYPVPGGYAYDKDYQHVPIWVESRILTTQGARLFQQDSVGSEVAMMIVGFTLLGLSAAAVFYFRAKVIPKMKVD